LLLVKKMRRRLPPMNALKAFEAAARHESFTKAAQELHLTQGAVSHQVKALETALGTNLFVREHQRLIITKAGRDYLAVVRDALDRLALGTDRLMQHQRSGALTVSVSPDFAAKWLVHRLGRWAKAQPDLEVRVSATLRHVDLTREDVDLAVRHGKGDWPGHDAVRLCTESLFPVCSPSLLAKARIAKPADLLQFPLLHLENWDTWSQWFEAAGVEKPRMRGPAFNHASLLIDAAVNGQGIALARTTLAAADLIAGRLIKLLDVSLRTRSNYWIVCPQASATLRKVAMFRDWLLAEAAQDLRQLKALDARR
jgi:LysR family transcriptional regulator, glycine cleavage system transcriptional activator